MKAKKWVLVKEFKGAPKISDIQLQEEELEPLKENEILCEAVYLSIDPYMRSYMSRYPIPSTMTGQQLAKVTETRNKAYPEGTLLLGKFGWRTHTIVNPDNQPITHSNLPFLLPMPEIGDLPASLALGTLGMTGLSGYLGFLKLCRPKEGETVFVNAAAGSVGSIVGQVAKIMGCRVVGCCGNDAKCQWLKEELGFDYVFNYKKKDLGEALAIGAPNGIDCYFDNVGGTFTLRVLADHMNEFGRVSLCGAVSHYNDLANKPSSGPYPYVLIIRKQISMEGFLVYRWVDEHNDAIKQMADWIREGRLKHKEHVTEGFENAQKAFYGMLRGENTGKAVVKI